MHVRLKVAVRTLHSLFEMDVLQMHRALEVAVRDDVVVAIQPVALLILLEHRAEHPSMTVIIRKLSVLQLGIQFRDLLQKIKFAPQSARRGSLGIRHGRSHEFLVGRIVLLLGIHEFGIRLLIPPDISEIWIHEEVALVHVTIHAL